MQRLTTERYAIVNGGYSRIAAEIAYILYLMWSASRARKRRSHEVETSFTHLLGSCISTHRVSSRSSHNRNEIMVCTLWCEREPPTHASSERLKIGCVSLRPPNRMPATIQQIALASNSHPISMIERPKSVRRRRWKQRACKHAVRVRSMSGRSCWYVRELNQQITIVAAWHSLGLDSHDYQVWKSVLLCHASCNKCFPSTRMRGAVLRQPRHFAFFSPVHQGTWSFDRTSSNNVQ